MPHECHPDARSDLPAILIMVTTDVAQTVSLSPSIALTSERTMVRVRPGRMTSAYATIRLPLAGASKFSLYS
ncbi:MAG: hypothetical protein VX955_07370, partial [Pseudomonadota bacterium]|nr:hypothetical protein [Pseudomonadota bacterium]